MDTGAGKMHIAIRIRGFFGLSVVLNGMQGNSSPLFMDELPGCFVTAVGTIIPLLVQIDRQLRCLISRMTKKLIIRPERNVIIEDLDFISLGCSCPDLDPVHISHLRCNR
jgi:hypothetical protein